MNIILRKQIIWILGAGGKSIVNFIAGHFAKLSLKVSIL